MAGDPHRPTMAAYMPHFLSISMTFIYRQLMGIAAEMEPVVLTTRVEHREAFPFPYPVYCRAQNRWERAWCKGERLLRGRYVQLSPLQERDWRRRLRQRQVRLIHAHFGPSGLEILPVARALGVPLVVSFLGFDASQALRDPRYVRDLRRLFAYAEVIAISQVMAERLTELGADPARMQVLHCGVPLAEYRFVERTPICEKVARQEPVEFLQVANFVEKKGHNYTLRAFATLLERYSRARLTFVGDGPLREAMEAECRQLGIADQVSFLGKKAKTEVIPLLQAADVFLHHSVTATDGDQEGIPTAIMDAMATGLPVIATRHSGIPEIVADSIDGLLVEERDVAAYGRRMQQILEDDGRLGQRARARALEEFDDQRQNGKLLEIYRKVIHDHENRR